MNHPLDGNASDEAATITLDVQSHPIDELPAYLERVTDAVVAPLIHQEIYVDSIQVDNREDGEGLVSSLVVIQVHAARNCRQTSLFPLETVVWDAIRHHTEQLAERRKGSVEKRQLLLDQAISAITGIEVNGKPMSVPKLSVPAMPATSTETSRNAVTSHELSHIDLRRGVIMLGKQGYRLHDQIVELLQEIQLPNPKRVSDTKGTPLLDLESQRALIAQLREKAELAEQVIAGTILGAR